jgi:hypothetical protein
VITVGNREVLGDKALPPVSWASAASAEVDAAGSKIEALEG